MSRYVIDDPGEDGFLGQPRGAGLARRAGAGAAGDLRALLDLCRARLGGGPSRATSRPRDVAGRPVIFCRDREGAVRCFLNTCRHRGALVCTEREGSTRYFTCPYHGWTYDSDGALRNVPGDDAYGPHFDKRRFGLVPPPRLRAPIAISISSISTRDAAGPRRLSRRRHGIYRPRRRPVAVGTARDRRGRAGIRHPRQLEAAGREQRRRLPPAERRIRPGSTTCARPA